MIEKDIVGGAAHLWENQLLDQSTQPSMNYLRVALRGTASNRDGIGSLIVLQHYFVISYLIHDQYLYLLQYYHLQIIVF